MKQHRSYGKALRALVVVLVISVGTAQLVLSATPAAAGSCSSQGGQNVTDPNTGWRWTTKWWCGNRGGASMYRDASYATKTAIMDTTSSWFVCYRRGVTHAGGNNVWYYTQGDRAVAGQTARRGWGYMPAVDVWTSTDPWPGMPACPSGSTPPPPPPANCIHHTFKFFPGSATSNLRYGEVDFQVDACSNVSPANWGRSVTHISTNGTGSALGFSLTEATISTTSSGYGYANYEGIINFETCLPLRLPLCEESDTPFKVRLHGYVDIEAGTNAPHVFFAGGEAPLTYNLFTTP